MKEVEVVVDAGTCKNISVGVSRLLPGQSLQTDYSRADGPGAEQLGLGL